MPDNLNINQTTNYPRNALIIPFGVGVRWHLNDNFTLNSEIVARKIFSDFADGIQADVNSKRLHDYYFLGGVSLTYSISNNGNKKASHNNRSLSSGLSCPRF